ncbi:MAG: rod shape-determining protein MreC [Solidesulfovibrio sp.]|uniref:rod shape-determining protein MreC n=1 Tax=Solidesulfovibrio sp. TaxID=2910990 RepID=UPI00315836E6
MREQVSTFWTRYLYFVGIREQNDVLRRELDAAKDELTKLRENAAEVERLRRLLSIAPPEEWKRQATRVITHRLGPNAALETFVIDKGGASGVTTNTPVVSPEGVVGRVLRYSPSAATVLLITDPNSRIPVVSQKSRAQGVLKGEGPDRELSLQYVPQGVSVEEGEILVTSGVEEIFPKGLPVARVTAVGRSGSSLFQVIRAAPLFGPQRLEEAALLFKGDPVPVAAPADASAPEPASAPGKPGKFPKTPAAMAPPQRPAAPPAPSAAPPSGQKREAAPSVAPAPSGPKREAVSAGQKREAAPADGAERKKSRAKPRTEGQ